MALPRWFRSRPARRRGLARVGLDLGHPDRVTVALAATTAATAGAVLVGDLARRFRRRASRAERAGEWPLAGAPEATAEALQLASRATQDTVRVAIEGYEASSRQELVLFNLLGGFAGSFAIARLSSTGIRSGWWPLGNVRIGGRHIHHFVPGIVMAFAAATAALLTDDLDREAALALPFGVGVGLTFDEAALLLDLRDVYWTREGLLSVQLSLGGLALLSSTILALRLLRRGELRSEDAGLIPDAAGELVDPQPPTA